METQRVEKKVHWMDEMKVELTAQNWAVSLVDAKENMTADHSELWSEK